MSQSTIYSIESFDSQQTIKDMPDSMDYYVARFKKQEFKNTLNQDIQDISHFITPRITLSNKITPPTPIKRKRMEMDGGDDIEEFNDTKPPNDPFFFDDIECDEFDAKCKVTKILFPPLIKRKSLILYEVK